MVKKLSDEDRKRLKLWEVPDTMYDERKHPNLRNKGSNYDGDLDSVAVRNSRKRNTTRGNP